MILFNSIQMSTTGRILLKKLGPYKLLKNLMKFTDELEPKYLAQWNANLAKLYLEHFTIDELKSLDREKFRSKYLGKFYLVRSKIKKEMINQSRQILIEAGAIVTKGVFEETYASKQVLSS